MPLVGGTFGKVVFAASERPGDRNQVLQRKALGHGKDDDERDDAGEQAMLHRGSSRLIPKQSLQRKSVPSHSVESFEISLAVQSQSAGGHRSDETR